MALEHAGRSILEMLWEQAVIQYDKFSALHEEQPVTARNLGTLDADHVEAYLVTQGKLRGIAFSIAMMLNPAKPNVDDVKKQIREQWESEQDDEEE